MPSTSLNTPRSRPAPQEGGPAGRVAEFEALYRARRPVWLATGATGATGATAVAAAAATAAVMALSSAPAAAYSVTRHADGTVTITVTRPSGVTGANLTLHGMHARVVVVPVRPGCPSLGSLPHPRPAPHPKVFVGAGVNGSGHRSVTVKVWGKGGIPRGDTMVLAFSGNPRNGGAVGAGGIITGPVPHCVSLPPPPSGGSGTSSASGG